MWLFAGDETAEMGAAERRQNETANQGKQVIFHAHSKVADFVSGQNLDVAPLIDSVRFL